MKATPSGVIFLLQVLFLHFGRSTKVWLPRVDFTDASNWVPPVLPSTGQKIVFSNKLNALVGLPSGILTISSLVLPQQGGLLIPDHSFSLNIATSDLPGEPTATFKPPGRTPYYSSSNWASYDEQRMTRQLPNAAVPHAERIPCQYEMALFEVNEYLPKPIDMQYHESIEVGNVRFGASIDDLEDFHSFVSSELGQFLFYNAEDTLILHGKCDNAVKCPCQEPRQIDAICSNERCPMAHCLAPIRPSGHCCLICGSVFRMNVGTFPGVFDLQTFIEKLRRKFVSAEMDYADVEYHIGIDRTEAATVVQLIIVDKGEYGEKSIRMMNSLRPFFEKQFSSGFHISHAGQPHTPLEVDQVVTILLFTLIAVSAFFGILYMYHYDDTFVPRIRAAIRNRQFYPTPFVFARFDPTVEVDGVSVDVNFTDGVQAVTETREEPSAVHEVDDHHASSFNNPMYERQTAKACATTVVLDDVELQLK